MDVLLHFFKVFLFIYFAPWGDKTPVYGQANIVVLVMEILTYAIQE